MISLNKQPGIIDLKFIILTDKYLILVSEESGYVSLEKFLQLKKLNQKEINRIFKKILKIVKKIHRSKIALRNLKIENFVVHRGSKRVSIVDLEFSQQHRNSLVLCKTLKFGSPAMKPPEFFLKRKIDRNVIFFL